MRKSIYQPRNNSLFIKFLWVPKHLHFHELTGFPLCPLIDEKTEIRGGHFYHIDADVTGEGDIKILTFFR